MVEWSKATVCKTDWRNPRGGSNPSMVTKNKNIMKSLKETILESSSPYQNYDDVVKFAKTKDTFNEVKSDLGRRGKAFEITFNNDIVLHVEFLGYEECLYFFYKNDDELHSIASTTEPRKIDWEMLINNPKDWCDSKISDMNDNLKSTGQKLKAAERKYDRSGKSADSDKMYSLKRFYNGIESSINELSTLKSML